MVSLDLGCGTRKHRGCIGVDIRKVEGVDVLADVCILPFKDGSFHEVFLSHIVEHIDDLVNFMKEVWRVCKNHATIRIWTPHFTSHHSYENITHFHHLSSQSFNYFDRRTWQGKDFWFTQEIEFKARKKRLLFDERRLGTTSSKKLPTNMSGHTKLSLDGYFPLAEYTSSWKL